MHLRPRDVDVWLPPGYRRDPAARFPVLYMHDGQSLFDPADSPSGKAWHVDDVMARLGAAGRIREAIVVGVWSTARRRQEYMPMAPMRTGSGDTGDAPPASTLSSDAYVAFLVDELKPSIDAAYRTLPGRDDTFVAGSSMGALVSLYALARHPEVFGGVGALSTHWPSGDGVVIDWLADHLPAPDAHRLYFDHGTRTQDAAYAPYQQRMDAALRRRGYVEGVHWTSRVCPGDRHDERDWHDRLPGVLEFLLGPPRGQAAGDRSAGAA